eukprot:COSAG06_NODE_1909_length_8084_cov_66.552536_9_plen_98_part_00
MDFKTKRGFSHPNFGIGVSLYFSCSHLRQYLLRAIQSTRAPQIDPKSRGKLKDYSDAIEIIILTLSGVGTASCEFCSQACAFQACTRGRPEEKRFCN